MSKQDWIELAVWFALFCAFWIAVALGCVLYMAIGEWWLNASERYRRIKRKDMDPAYRTGQFKIPTHFRDAK